MCIPRNLQRRSLCVLGVLLVLSSPAFGLTYSFAGSIGRELQTLEKINKAAEGSFFAESDRAAELIEIDAARTVRPLELIGHGVPIAIVFAILFASIFLFARAQRKKGVAARALDADTENYDLAIEGSKDGFWDWDIGSGEMVFSSQFRSMLGYRNDGELPNRYTSWEEMLHAEDIANTRAAIEAHLKTGHPYDVQYRMKHKDGKYRWYRSKGQAVWDGNGNAIRMAGNVSDIDEFIGREEEIEKHREKAERAQKRFDAVFDNADSIIYVKKVGGDLLHVNRRFCEQFCFRKDDVIGKNEADLFGLAFAQDWQKEDTKIVSSSRTFYNDEKIPNPDGSINYFITQKYRIYDPVEREYIICVQSTDVTEQKAAEAKIKKLAYFDELTGLPNRACFIEDITEKFSKIGRQDKFSIIHIDLDNFKRANDTLGHSAGDKLLREVGKRLRLLIDDVGHAYRWGGDEFVVVIDETSDVALTPFCEEITDLLSIPVNYQASTLWPSASLGVARYPEDGLDLDSLMIHADLALYKSKEVGRDNFHFFTKDMRAKIDDEVQLERDLRNAINEGQFFLVFQPQVDIQTHVVTGLEGLLRWRHPKRGILSPGAFMDVIESTKLAPAVGQIVISQAFWAARKLLDEELDFGRMAINLSPQHLTIGNLLDDILDGMETYELPPKYVTAEVLESIFLDDPNSGKLEALEYLHNRGVHIELDDFGTGYASLSHLSSLPIDGLKIERSFTNKMLSDAKTAAVIQAFISLAKSLNIGLVCEGIETQEQMEKLGEFGPCSVQGYFICRPIPFDDLCDWLRAGPKIRTAKVVQLNAV